MRRLLALSLLSFSASLFAAPVAKPVSWEEGGTTFDGQLVFDDASDAKRPGLLMVPNWYGVNERAIEKAVEHEFRVHPVRIAGGVIIVGAGAIFARWAVMQRSRRVLGVNPWLVRRKFERGFRTAQRDASWASRTVRSTVVHLLAKAWRRATYALRFRDLPRWTRLLPASGKVRYLESRSRWL